MNRRWTISLIMVGVVIGLGISASLDWMTPASGEKNADQEAAQLRASLAQINKNMNGFATAIRTVAKLVKPSVVSIVTEEPKRRRLFRKMPRQRLPYPFFRFFDFDENSPPFQFEMPPRKGLGSGIIIDHEGHILTNDHVIQGFEDGKISVYLSDNRRYNAKIIGADRKSDLAIVKIDAKDLRPAAMGNSDDMEVGDWVVAIGSPFGYFHSVSAGIISALGRPVDLPSGVPFAVNNFIQTDAAINPGNSGGPLVNLRGEVIGISTAIRTTSGGYEGIGFAVPSKVAKKVMVDLIREGKVTRGYLGVEITNIGPMVAERFHKKSVEELLDNLGLKKPQGVFVNRVFAGAPADKAGIQPMDVIIEFDGKPTRSANELVDLVSNTRVGKNVDVVLIRDKKRKTVRVTVAEQPEGNPAVAKSAPSHKGQPGTASALGITVQNLTPALAQQFGYENEQGVLVAEVKPDSEAAKQGIEEGDLIVKVGLRSIKSVDDFLEEARKAQKEGEGMAVLVKSHRGGSAYVMIK